MSKRLAVVLFAASACAPSAAPVPGPSVSNVASPVTTDELRRDLSAFAADSFRGRETGTGDDVRAAAFIAARLAALGLAPAGDSGYFQRVPLTLIAITPSSRVTVTGASAPASLAIGSDVVPLITIGTGAQNPKLRANADLVFASYGIADAQLKRDDYAGLDLENKALVIVNAAPPGADSATAARFSGQGGVQNRLVRLIQSPKRPAAIVLLMAGDAGADLLSQAATLLRSVTPRDTSAMLPDDERLFPMILLARMHPGSPFLPADWPANGKARPLSGRRLAATIDVRRQQIMSYNVLGVVRGTTNANTYVAYGAHLDHIGISVPSVAHGDSINNGADDDGSGTVAMLAVARSVAQGPRPSRSMLFVWHTGEEKGLFGSQYFTEHPTVPIDSIVAQINADMIGRNHPDSMYIVGPAAAPNNQSRALGTIVDSVNASLAQPFLFNREWDSPTHPERIYFRSDHFMYARKQIPIVFFTSGLHDDYHKPSDEVAKIDFAKMVRAADLMRRVGWAVSERPSRPK